ncbi:MAG TPA: hypothetical protein DEV81_04490 [Cyanobacteria bacterium UBA11049]|nr:hypothetical protein [Cyanobacteria bacterium UBA11049]
METAVSQNFLNVQCSALSGQWSFIFGHAPLSLVLNKQQMTNDKKIGTSLLPLTNPVCRSLKRGEH